MRHPRLVWAARAPNRWERSRNVAWNQRFHKLRSYRGLMGPVRTRCAAQRRRSREGIGWRIHGGVCHVCVERPGCRGSRTHRKRRDVCATRPRGQGRRETTKIEIRKTNLECALESTVSLFGISLQHRRLGARWVAHTWRCLPWVRPEIVAEAGRRCGPTLITHDLNELPAL